MEIYDPIDAVFTHALLCSNTVILWYGYDRHSIGNQNQLFKNEFNVVQSSHYISLLMTTLWWCWWRRNWDLLHNLIAAKQNIIIIMTGEVVYSAGQAAGGASSKSNHRYSTADLLAAYKLPTSCKLVKRNRFFIQTTMSAMAGELCNGNGVIMWCWNYVTQLSTKKQICITSSQPSSPL